MSDDRNWKNDLLGCGLPLEFEVGKLLASKGFEVAADFCFARCESAAIRDFSVDIHARATVSFSSSPEVAGALDLLVECRPSHADTSWLFLPSPNGLPAPNGPDDSAGAVAHVIRGVDHFSPHFINAEATAAFDGQLPICCKGVEIHGTRGEAADSDLRRGIAQLQYALPRLLTRNILFYLGNQTEENVPFLFCPILVTEADLFVAHERMGVEVVRQSAELADLGDRVQYLVVCSDYGPEFEAHCKREFEAFEALARSENVVSVEQRRAGFCEREWELPFAIMESLTAAESYWLRRLFTQFVLCRKPALATLIDAMKEAAVSAMPPGDGLD